MPHELAGGEQHTESFIARLPLLNNPKLDTGRDEADGTPLGPGDEADKSYKTLTRHLPAGNGR